MSVSNESCLYFKTCEQTNVRRRFRLCLRRVRSPPTTDYEAIVVGSQGLDEEESSKVERHCDHTLRQLERVHKSLIWDVFVSVVGVDKRSGPSKRDKGRVSTEQQLEFDLDVAHMRSGDFDPDNPHTWDHESLILNVDSETERTELIFDSFVILFALDSIDTADVVANCLIEHLKNTRSQSIINNDTPTIATSSRSMSKSACKPSKGYCVCVSYTLLESVSCDALVGSCLNRGVDIREKKHQLMASLTTTPRLHSPQTSERLRRNLKQMPEGLSSTVVHLVRKMLETLKDNEEEKGAMLEQFIDLMCENRDKTDIEHLLAYLNRSENGNGNGDPSRPTNALSSLNKSGSIAEHVSKEDDNLLMSKSSCLPKPMARVVAVRTGSNDVNDMTRSVDPSVEFRRRQRPTTAPSTTGTTTSRTTATTRTPSTKERTRATKSTRGTGKDTTATRPPRLSSSSVASSSSSRTASPSSMNATKERITRDDLRRMNQRSNKN